MKTQFEQIAMNFKLTPQECLKQLTNIYKQDEEINASPATSQIPITQCDEQVSTYPEDSSEMPAATAAAPAIPKAIEQKPVKKPVKKPANKPVKKPTRNQ